MEDELYKKMKRVLEEAFDKGAKQLKDYQYLNDQGRAQYMMGLSAIAEALIKLETHKQEEERRKRKPSSLKTTL